MQPVYQEPDHTIYCGHALDILKGMPAESVDMVITSPPYWGLRTYKTEPIIWGENHCEHEWGNALELPPLRGGPRETASVKQCSNTGTVFAMQSSRQAGNVCLKCHAWKGELGLEPTIELYIEHLIQIFNEVKRVLKKTGTCWVNLDDSYAGGKGQSGCGDPEYQAARQDISLNKPYHQMGGHGLTRPADGNIGVPAKSLCLIPQRFAIAMVNAGWILRNDIAWNKPNPMPESVKDRFTGSWEHLFFFSKNRSYYFEQQFEAYTEPLNRWGGDFTKPTDYSKDSDGFFAVQEREGRNRRPNELGRNKRDVWEIATEPYPEAHFATFPEKLCETPILAGCPSMICKKCGKARMKIYGDSDWESHQSRGMAALDTPDSPMYRGGHHNDGLPYRPTRLAHIEGRGNDRVALREVTRAGDPHIIEMGYTDCGCNAGFEPGVLLDFFCGSGKALAVAKRLGRKSVGIDLNPDYCKLAARALQAVPLAMPLLAT